MSIYWSLKNMFMLSVNMSDTLILCSCLYIYICMFIERHPFLCIAVGRCMLFWVCGTEIHPIRQSDIRFFVCDVKWSKRKEPNRCVWWLVFCVCISDNTLSLFLQQDKNLRHAFAIKHIIHHVQSKYFPTAYVYNFSYQLSNFLPFPYYVYSCYYTHNNTPSNTSSNNSF